MSLEGEAREGGSGKQQKIRGSCDACSVQKIRCSKQRPSCTRCSTKSIPCEYGLSMRTGRRSGQNRAASQSVSSNATASSSTLRPHPQLSSGEDVVFSTAQSTAIQPEQSTTLNNDDDMWMFADLLTDTTNNNNQTSMFGESTTTTTMIDFNQPITATSVAMDDSASSTASLDILAHLSRPRFDSVLQTTQTAAMTDMFDDHTSFGEPVNHDHSISCLTTALQIIVELHVSGRTCFSSASNSLLGAQTISEEPRDMNTVLDYNRQALWKAVRVLDCPCSRERGVVEAICMAIHKVISWYAAAIGVDSAWMEQDSIDRVTNPPIYMGNYCLDPQAQKLARAHVVISELREHVQPLLTRLDRWQSNSASASNTTANSPNGSPSASTPSPPDLDVIECHRRGLWEEFNALIAKADGTWKG